MSDKAPSDEAVEAFFAEIDFPINATLEEIEDRFRRGLVAALPFLLADEREAREKLVEALREIAEHKPQSIGTREVHDGEDWKQAEYFEPFAWKHAIGIARAALSGSPEEADRG